MQPYAGVDRSMNPADYLTCKKTMLPLPSITAAARMKGHGRSRQTRATGSTPTFTASRSRLKSVRARFGAGRATAVGGRTPSTYTLKKGRSSAGTARRRRAGNDMRARTSIVSGPMRMAVRSSRWRSDSGSSSARSWSIATTRDTSIIRCCCGSMWPDRAKASLCQPPKADGRARSTNRATSLRPGSRAQADVANRPPSALRVEARDVRIAGEGFCRKGFRAEAPASRVSCSRPSRVGAAEDAR